MNVLCVWFDTVETNDKRSPKETKQTIVLVARTIR